MNPQNEFALRRNLLTPFLLLFQFLAALLLPATSHGQEREQHRLYVAVPGIRNDLKWGGTGILVFDMDHEHRFVKRIPTLPIAPGEEAEAVKGVCASAKTGRLYFTTPKRLVCLDLRSEQILWNRTYEGGCDRLAIAPDGITLYLPSLEGPFWRVVDALSGDVKQTVQTQSGSHNTVYGLNGKECYLAGLKSPYLFVAETAAHTTRKVGPFSNVIRPFTVNGRQSLCYVNVNERLGFEVGDLKSGKVLYTVDVTGYDKGKVDRHGCPSHGIALTPDEKQLWLSDGHNSRIHIFDTTQNPPRQMASLPVRDQPGWITFSLDGRYAYPSSGEVVRVRDHTVLSTLTDENGGPVASEKMVEIVFRGGSPVRTGDQFGIGRKK